MRERADTKEQLGRGSLLTLAHPTNALAFSGYGLTTVTGKRDSLVGLLMIDRPKPADPQWLQLVADTFGACQLVPITTSGERGIACHMQVHPDSIQHLRPFPGQQAIAIQAALQPLLEEPPAPRFHLQWDATTHSWRSEFADTHALIPEVRAVFENTGYGCLAVEQAGRVVHVCHASDRDIAGFDGQPVQAQWQLIKKPTAALIRLQLRIYDQPENPFHFESFLNAAAGDQQRILAQLANQEELHLAFYGDDLQYQYTATIAHSQVQWQQLDEFTAQAVDYWQQLPPLQRNFDRAKAAFMAQGS